MRPLRLTGAVVAAYGLLALTLPRRLRRLRRTEMVELFQEVWLEESRARGTFAGLRFMFGAALRLLGTSWQARFGRDDRGPVSPGRGGRRTAGWLQDILYGLRMIRHRPGFALTVIVTLAVAIGVNSTIFSMVRFMIFVPIPFEERAGLVVLRGRNLELNRLRAGLSLLDTTDLADAARNLEGVAPFVSGRFALTGLRDPVRVAGMQVGVDYFRVTGVRAVIGRSFSQREAELGEAVVLLSHGAWQRRFGANPDILQRSIQLDGVEHRVIGVVMPEMEFGSLRVVEVWTPVVRDPSAARDQRTFSVIARLAEHSTQEAAQAEVTSIAARLAARHPETNAGWDVEVFSLRQSLLGENAARVLAILTLAVGFVLAIACVNVANLLLARSAGRRRELAVRQALGASRLRLMRQLLTESVLLAVAASVLGLGLTRVLFASLVAATRSRLPFFTELSIDPAVVLFALGLALITPIAFAVLPAIRGTGADLHGGLKDGGGGRTVGRQRRSSRMLVASQMALALILLVVASMASQSIIKLTAMELGFDSESTLTLVLEPGPAAEPLTDVTTLREVEGALLALPTVAAVGITSHLPIVGAEPDRSLQIEGVDEVAPEERLRVATVFVTPRFFEASRIPLRSGQLFTTGEDAAPAVLISERARESFWVQRDPLGTRVRLGQDPRWHEVVGVVGDVRNPDADQPPEPHVYMPLAEAPVLRVALMIRTAAEPQRSVGAVRTELSRILPGVPVEDVRTMNEVLYDDFASDYAIIGLVTLFALTALALAVAGTYGVIAYTVSRRLPEIGVRMALGAHAGEVVRMVLRQGLAPVAAGTVIGWAAGYGLSRLMAGMLYGLRPLDPITFLGMPLALLLAAVLACSIPARRAARVDPVDSLRTD